MEQAKHAKGPWTISETSLLRGHVSIDAESHGCLALAVWQMEDDEIDGVSSDSCRANARLIAAAPDLLATLSQIERLSREADGNLVNVRSMLGDIARAAITRATKGD